MKKLKQKILLVLISILTMFLLSILIIYNYQGYKQELERVNRSLEDMKAMNSGDVFNKDNIELPERPNNNMIEQSDRINKENSVEPATEPRRIFIDAEVYTVFLDNSNQIKSIESHAEDGKSEEEIKIVAQKIINSSNIGKNIGNLYNNKYSYNFKDKQSITIVENTNTNKRLRNVLRTSICIFVLIEIVIILVSIKITNWIIKPVIETFNKQKRFIQDASHELKTPLSVIIASEDAYENDHKEKWLENIKNESDRMSRLINNLLELARLEETDIKPIYSENDLSKIIEKSVLAFEGLIYENNIELEYNIEDNIKLKCDSDQIEQLSGILIDNAIKHSVGKGKIIVNLNKNKDEIIFKVINKGEPINKKDEEKIFERFYRADESRNRGANRYGLGLAIAKNIVQKHNGKISAHSDNGFTTFKVILK